MGFGAPVAQRCGCLHPCLRAAVFPPCSAYRWDNDALRALKSLPGADFEAVDVSRLLRAAGSGAVTHS
jgi:hypothetical protein